MNRTFFININDIEDLITAKIQIDKDNPEIVGRSELNNFIQTYCILNYILTNNVISIPFQIAKIFGKQYVFYSSDSIKDAKLLKDLLEPINYDFTKLHKQSLTEMYDDNILEATDKYYILHNNHIYTFLYIF